MNKNTTDITLSSYFNDIVVGFYEDEDLVKDFGRKLGIDVDRDVFTAVSFLYVSDAYVRMEDQEKLIPAAQALLDYAPINQKIGGMQIVRTDMGVVVILIAHCKKDMYYMLPDVKQEALKQLEKMDSDIKVRVGIGTMESGIKGIKHTYRNSLDAVRTGEIFKPDRVILEFMGMEIYSAINEMVLNFGDRLTRTVLMQLGDPLLRPIRNLLPSMGGIDFSPMVLVLLLYVINMGIAEVLQATGNVLLPGLWMAL